MECVEAREGISRAHEECRRLSGKKAFAFDTKMSKSRLAGSAGGKIERKQKNLSLTIAKHSESATVKGREGPLEKSAEETFRQTGAELAKML